MKLKVLQKKLSTTLTYQVLGISVDMNESIEMTECTYCLPDEVPKPRDQGPKEASKKQASSTSSSKREDKKGREHRGREKEREKKKKHAGDGDGKKQHQASRSTRNPTSEDQTSEGNVAESAKDVNGPSQEQDKQAKDENSQDNKITIHDRMFIRRQQIIREIVQTEQAYVNNLQILIKVARYLTQM